MLWLQVVLAVQVLLDSLEWTAAQAHQVPGVDRVQPGREVSQVRPVIAVPMELLERME